MDEGTVLREQLGIRNQVDARTYIRTLATARILLHNIPHIQSSWLTVGKTVGQICLHAGANDFGSVMIEENVVSSAGASNQMDISGMKESIREAGFIPRLRNQLFEMLD
jgi:cyclic dehypoxanthinyl futalosine synthase